MTALLETRGLEVFYGDFQAVFGVDFRVEEGETVAIIGANGAGKSSFLKALSGLVKSRPDGILLDGRPMGGRPAYEMVKAGVALVPEGRRLFPSLSVADNLLMGENGRSGDRGWTYDSICELFPILRERAHQLAPTLSGGQQQMVAIGRALITNPRVLLCDEISLGLSPAAVNGGLTVVFGAVGLCASTVSLALLSRGRRESINVRGAYLEVMADALGSVLVVVAAVVIAMTGFRRADPIASLLIVLMIAPRTWKLLRDASDVLLEAVPKDVNLAEVRAHILSLPGVEGLHDLHVWTITSGLPVLSAHVVVAGAALAERGHGAVLHDLQGCLGDHFAVEHCTFQLEPAGHAEHESGLCH